MVAEDLGEGKQAEDMSLLGDTSLFELRGVLSARSNIRKSHRKEQTDCCILNQVMLLFYRLILLS